MRLYHFLPLLHGISDICCRRLKLARVKDMNDPFELFPASPERNQRLAMSDVRKITHQSHGFLCFSRSWHNPVLWSHYADGHRGLCLAFDVPEAMAKPITYSDRRPVFGEADYLFTKFLHWQYEDEVRFMLPLDAADISFELENRFVCFSDELALRQIIVGARCGLSRADLSAALGDLSPYVDQWKARISFNDYKIVRQKRSAEWR